MWLKKKQPIIIHIKNSVRNLDLFLSKEITLKKSVNIYWKFARWQSFKMLGHRKIINKSLKKKIKALHFLNIKIVIIKTIALGKENHRDVDKNIREKEKKSSRKNTGWFLPLSSTWRIRENKNMLYISLVNPLIFFFFFCSSSFTKAPKFVPVSPIIFLSEIIKFGELLLLSSTILFNQLSVFFIFSSVHSFAHSIWPRSIVNLF